MYVMHSLYNFKHKKIGKNTMTTSLKEFEVTNLSQLITTIDVTNLNIGIGNTIANGTTHAIALGSGQNIGIGTNAPLSGLHLGASGNTIPAIYLTDATAATLPTIGTNDGIFSVKAGVPTFTNVSGSTTILTGTAQVVGTGTLVAGSMIVTEANVTTSSIIFVTRTSTTGDVTTVGTLSVIAGTGSFTVDSTVVTDIGNFNYFIY